MNKSQKTNNIPQYIQGAILSRLLLALPTVLLLLMPAAVQAQYDYTTTNGTITITGYAGAGGAVTIPSTINGLPVTSIGNSAFADCWGLTSVTIPNSVTSIGNHAFTGCSGLTTITVDTANPAYSSLGRVLFNMSQTQLISCPGGMSGTYAIPNSVTSIGDRAFSGCSGLTSVTIPNSVTSIGDWAFCGCSGLTGVTIPNSVTSIGELAFRGCFGLTSVTIGNSVTSIGDWAFIFCSGLSSVYFKGDAPEIPASLGAFSMATVYYLPGTTGWGLTFGYSPTALWKPQVQTSGANFGVRTNQFGFNITWANGQVIVVEACTNLATPTWLPLQTNTLSGDSFYFSDSQWRNYPARFYRLRWP